MSIMQIQIHVPRNNYFLFINKTTSNANAGDNKIRLRNIVFNYIVLLGGLMFSFTLLTVTLPATQYLARC